MIVCNKNWFYAYVLFLKNNELSKMTTQLYSHQQIAIDTVVDNKFASGVIQYATGSGKTFNI